MIKGNIKRLIIPTIYVLSATLIIAGIFLIVNGINKFLNEKTDYKYSIDNVFEDTTPVISEKTSIIKPYLSELVKVGRYFYDFEASDDSQVGAIIYYEGTYMQNSGVDYISDESFDVVSVLDGEVTKINKDEILGNTVQIKHEKDLISIYQGVDNINIKEGAKINQGEIIATSAKSLINPDYKNSMHFEVYYKGKLMDPENLYSLTVEDLE